MRITNIEWMLWSRSGEPTQRWSIMHRTVYDSSKNEQRTLCGRKIPDAFVYNKQGMGDLCRQCEKVEKKFVSD